jgi:hypothetical protein
MHGAKVADSYIVPVTATRQSVFKSFQTNNQRGKIKL